MHKSKSSNDSKAGTLRQHGALNPRAEKVTDPLFQKNPFFDPRDLLQVKYEMLRRTQKDGLSVSRASRNFGFSRPSFYQAQAAFERHGLLGLVSKKRGPQGGHKLTAKVVDFVEKHLAEDSTLKASALVELVAKRFEISVHPRSLERALARRKKKLPATTRHRARSKR